jgi:hypothetical protein
VTAGAANRSGHWGKTCRLKTLKMYEIYGDIWGNHHLYHPGNTVQHLLGGTFYCNGFIANADLRWI